MMTIHDANDASERLCWLGNSFESRVGYCVKKGEEGGGETLEESLERVTI